MSSSYSYSYNMPNRPNVYYANESKYTKASKNMKGTRAENSAEMFIARNFASSVHKIIMDISGKDLALAFQFDAGGGGSTQGLMPKSFVDKCVQVNTGPSKLITSLVTAKNEKDIDKALKNDFTKVVEKLEPSDSGGGSGSGFQIYVKGVQVLSVGSGGGGGYSQIDNEDSYQSRSYSKSQKHDVKWVLDRGGGGGGQIIVRLPQIKVESYYSDDTKALSKSGKERKLYNTDSFINVGGGQGLEDGKMVFSFDEDYHPHEFVKQMQMLGKLLSEADENDVAVLGGGGGGGAGCGPNGKDTEGGGYGFGFQIGTPRAIKRAKDVAGGSGNGGCGDMSYLSKQEENEAWARNMRKYMKKYGSC